MAWKLAVAILALAVVWAVAGWPEVPFALAMAAAAALIIWDDTRA